MPYKMNIPRQNIRTMNRGFQVKKKYEPKQDVLYPNPNPNPKPNLTLTLTLTLTLRGEEKAGQQSALLVRLPIL